MRRLAAQAIVLWIAATARRRWRVVEREDICGVHDADETIAALVRILGGINQANETAATSP